MLKKLALALGTLVVTALLAEGVLSLCARSSLRDLVEERWPTHASPPVPTPHAPTPAPPAKASPPVRLDGRNKDGSPAPGGGEAGGPDNEPGLYRIDEDPRVSYSLRPDAELTIYDTLAHTDSNGFRVLAGPPAGPGSLRVVVLGDSVAFGFGVNDDQTLAARLQDALATVRGPAEPPIECRTVGTPSWNHRSALAFLLDHWDALRADIVVYVPCKNDVFDLDSIYENGTRRMTADPGAADPWLTVSIMVTMDEVAQQVAEHAGKTIAPREMGAFAIDVDLSPESARRYDENAASIVKMRDALAERGAKLLLCWTSHSDYDWNLSTRLDQLAPDIASVGFVDYMPAGGTLGYDPHPSAPALEVFGTWLAADLLDRGWVGRGANLALPPVPPEYAERRSPWAGPAVRADRRNRARDVALKTLQPEIDFRTGRGLKQVYGGLNHDTTARTKMLVLLKPGGDTVQVELAPLEGRPDLYPLRVAVAVDGEPVGEVVVPPDGPGAAVLPLPSGRPDHPVEVSLVPEAAVLLRPKGRGHVASFQPVRIACSPR